MATRLLPGIRTWSMDQDENGDRVYRAVYRVVSDAPGKDGPQQVLDTAGLPEYGEIWLIENDEDIWAFRRQPIKVTPVTGENDLTAQWDVEVEFTTKADAKRCMEERNTDPLLIPDRISGGSVKYVEEATRDRFGQPIKYSSHEQIRGSQIEFDANRHRITVEQNVPQLELALVNSMLDTVNDSYLWGMPPRTVKLSDFKWTRKFYGLCEVYFERTLEFDVDPRTFDRDILDQGTKVLNGHWGVFAGTGSATESDWVLDNINGAAPDPANPQHFIRAKDRNGENITLPLNGAGLPAGLLVSNGVRSGPFYVSVRQDNVGNNLNFEIDNQGNALNSSWWERVTSQEDPSSPAAWVSKPYGAGSLVTYGGQTWIALMKTSLWDTPTFGILPWLQLGSLVDAGVYDATKKYTFGQYVRDRSNPTQEGVIHVEKYPESDFLLLGIPTDLES